MLKVQGLPLYSEEEEEGERLNRLRALSFQEMVTSKHFVRFSLPAPSMEEKALAVRNHEGTDHFQHLLWVFGERTC